MTANLRVQIARRAGCPAHRRTRRCASGRRNEMFAALNQPVPPEIAGRPRRTRSPRRQAAATAAAARRPTARRRRRRGCRDVASAGSRGHSRAVPRRRRPARRGEGGQRRPRARGQRRLRRRRRLAAADCGGGVGRFGGGGGGDGGDRQARMLERFKAHVAGRAEAVHRAHEGARRRHERVRKGHGAQPAQKPRRQRRRAPTPGGHDDRCVVRSAADRRASQGRAWLYVDKQLKPVNLRTRHHRRHEHRGRQRRTAARAPKS